MKVGGYREVTLWRYPECGEERVECSFEFGNGVAGFDVEHCTLWLRIRRNNGVASEVQQTDDTECQL